MRLIAVCLIPVVCALLVLPVRASGQPGQDERLISVKRFELSSRVLRRVHSISVSLPDEYVTQQQRYPVLIVLDADDRDQFRAAVSTVRFLAGRLAIPQFIIIGLHFRWDRAHELTPLAYAPGAAWKPGGADSTYRFLADELLPWVDGHYRTLPVRALAGHSLGGLFALHVLATYPTAFRVVIAMSPSLTCPCSPASSLGPSYAHMIAQDTVHLRTLFMTSGGREPPIDDSVRPLATLLDSNHPATLSFAYRRYPLDDHELTPYSSLGDGLRTSFEPLAMPLDSVGWALGYPHRSDSASLMSARDMLEARYAGAARRFGLPEVLPEPVLNSLGWIALDDAGAPVTAVALFRENTERYPRSEKAFDSLGDGLLAAGDTAAAITAYRRAISRFVRTRASERARSRSKLDALLQRKARRVGRN